jgi:hypothetical protein
MFCNEKILPDQSIYLQVQLKIKTGGGSVFFLYSHAEAINHSLADPLRLFCETVIFLLPHAVGCRHCSQ